VEWGGGKDISAGQRLRSVLVTAITSVKMSVQGQRLRSVLVTAITCDARVGDPSM
jgi:hypothetical protein